MANGMFMGTGTGTGTMIFPDGEGLEAQDAMH
jgi:hypothetical protein